MMGNFQVFDPALLDGAGLNRQAVFDLDALPTDIAAAVAASCTPGRSYRQLILIGHAGRKLWQSVTAAGIASDDPIDDFTVRTVRQWFAGSLAQHAYDILYPGTQAIGLQRLGQLAGWHHASPFMVGIDSEWGSWYAYRALVVADTRFEPTRPVRGVHPCATCQHRVCVTSCPAGALSGEQFDLAKCVAYRKREGSQCRATCLARISCPVGSSHRYCDAQIRHTYVGSMRAIERYY
ncbi:hypothetical protein [Noviherbaspirillum sp. UKPF54]|uniref:hypothetical protein n=1 Tax=Noviherbaspirillum sp. UKPF54 TaxID=2601898 RepID=UPI0011B14069|nr:hypothetical protein [Noviherbaspirillum sp. UKPF54]QDZ26813.1 hypothetical protein FAY22_01815 [Noviherbaspirillum sp. UKPF54]